jgi:MFS family permease
MFGNRSILLDNLLAEAPRPEAIRRHRMAPWLAVGVVCFGAFMGQLDASIVTLTFRPMEQEFGATLAAVQWVSLAYLLVLVALVTPAGRIADAVGRKLVYGYGFVVFTAGSAACAFAPSLGILIACRVLQAVGAAMLQANSVALVTTSVPRERMRLALSVQAAAQAIGLGLGPTLGGVLTEAAGWRAVYWINVPVGCLAVVAGRYLLPRTRPLRQAVGRRVRPAFDWADFDWLGAGLLGAASTSLLIALSAVGGLPAPGWLAPVMAAAAVAASIAFWRRQNSAPVPLIPVALLRSGRVVTGLAGAVLGYLALFGPLVLIPQLLTGAGNVVRTGLILSALPAGFGVAALAGEAIFPAGVANRVRGFIGGVVCTGALVMLMVMTTGPIGIALKLGLAGLGLGVFVPANNAVVMRSGSAGSAAVLGGLVSMARGIGTTFGIALVTLGLHLTGPGRAHAALLPFGTLAAAAACAAVLALTIRPLGSRPPADSSGLDDSSAFS